MYQFIEPRLMSDSVKIAIQRDWLVTPNFQVNCVVAKSDAVLYGTIGLHS
jgi:pyrimidine deaminase RibD-like protein